MSVTFDKYGRMKFAGLFTFGGNVISLTSVKTNTDFTAVAGTAYYYTSSSNKTVTMPVGIEGDVIRFYVGDTTGDDLTISGTVLNPDGTALAAFAPFTTYEIQYINASWRVSIRTIET